MKIWLGLVPFFISFSAAVSPGNELPEKSCFEVRGMTCASCSLTVKSAVRQLKGIKEISVSVKNSEATVYFDKQMTTTKDINKKINEIGGDYKSTVKQCKS